MLKILSFYALGVLPLLTISMSHSAQADNATLSPIKVVLVGDSTVATNGGWGPAFAKLLKPQAQCVNWARGGRSSKSYRAEGFWKEALAEKPNFLFIQFGHNDQPGKGPERETDPNTTYAQNIAHYIEEARAIGATPIVVTSLTRRHFDAAGRITSDLTDYVEAAKRVAITAGAPLIDLNARSIEELNALGPVDAVRYDKPSADPAKPDRTHLSDYGGQATALLVAREVQKVVPALGQYLVALPPVSVRNSAASTKADSIVAADGSGQFKTVQEAIDAAPSNRETPFVILIKPGTYKAHVVIPAEKTNLVFRGEDAGKTILTNDWHVKTMGADGKEVGTIGSASVVVSAPGFRAENITFENNAPHVAQALAIYVQGDRAVFQNCRFLGWQDTIRVRRGRQYFRDCYINGRTDFIYGEATAYFDRCHIHILESGWITAANTPQEQPYGLVFSNCKITSEPGIKTKLGRPWRPYAMTVWLNTEMNDVIEPEGWDNWRNPDNEKTARYSEYASKNSDGTLVDLSKRVAWAKTLTAEEAANYRLEKVLGDWNPLAP